MKLPRQARIFSGRLDAAPFAGVFFCLLLLLLLLGGLLYTPGVKLEVELPRANGLPGAAVPNFVVALDLQGRLAFENQVIQADDLKQRLAQAQAKTTEPLTLVIQADKNVSYETLLGLTLLAREAGVKQIHLALLPHPFAAPPARP